MLMQHIESRGKLSFSATLHTGSLLFSAAVQTARRTVQSVAQHGADAVEQNIVYVKRAESAE